MSVARLYFNNEIIKKVLAVLAISIVLGLLSNFFNPNRIQWTGTIKDADDTAKIDKIDFNTAYSIFKEGKAIFLDARYPGEYENGHIPDALNIPADLFENYFESLKDIKKETPIVVYCSGPGCHLGPLLAEILKGLSYKNIKLFSDGFYFWEESGGPVQKGATEN